MRIQGADGGDPGGDRPAEIEISGAVHAAKKAGLAIPTLHRAPAPSGTRGWHTDLNNLSPQTLGHVTAAAKTRNITPQAYMDRRQLALKLAQEGRGYAHILKETGETNYKIVSAWLSAARAAGYSVPYTSQMTLADHDAGPAVEAHPKPSPPITDRVFPPPAFSSIGSLRKAAEARGMTVQAYQDHREMVVQLRRNGKSRAEIAPDDRRERRFRQGYPESRQAFRRHVPGYRHTGRRRRARRRTPEKCRLEPPPPAHRLRRARIAAGYRSASAAARAMGVPLATYAQHERGARGFSAETQDRYLAFFRRNHATRPAKAKGR